MGVENSISMQIDANMISNQTNNKRTEPEVLTDRTRVRSGTEGNFHGSDSVEQQVLRGRQSTTARGSNQKCSRVSNKKNEVESRRKPTSVRVLLNELLPIT